MKNKILLSLLFCTAPLISYSQNQVGIGTTDPTEKLEVAGIIYTNQGGVRFPDETLQTTAAFNNADPEDGAAAKLRPYLLITTTNPALPDTMFLLDVQQGGISGNGGATNPAPFRVIKELDKSTPNLMRKVVNSTILTNARIEFPRASQTDHVYETIELRNASITDIEYQGKYRADGTYAHLEVIDFVFQKIEIKYLIGTDVCYCWDYVMNMACTCD